MDHRPTSNPSNPALTTRVTVELLALLLGLAAPLASYHIRIAWRPLSGSIQVALALLITVPMLALVAKKAKVSAMLTALVLAIGIVLGAVTSYAWWFTTVGDRTWRISKYVFAYEAAFLVAIASFSYAVSFLFLRRKGMVLRAEFKNEG